MLVRYLPAFLLVGCTLVLSEGDPDSEQTPDPSPTPDAGNLPGDAGASNGGSGAGAAQAGGAGGEGGDAVDPMGGQGATGGAATATPGLGNACTDDSGCPEGAPECPAAAGYCTFYCDEAWINGWQYVPSLVAQCEEGGGECTPIGEERSYCVP